MSAPLSTALRARPDTLVVTPGDGARLVFRVQSLDDWDTVRVDAPADAAVATVVASALAVLDPRAALGEMVVKHRGHEVTDPSASLQAVGVRDGSILSVAARRRRPVR